ncbi:MAG TPA: multifunctional oxoglutarate decarboxylase/oxoglutarate dehydrogenase thiamine pyrophosphate-binding subunit/dihydrolipoyllysine-residue succinyltransferase subunit, partial [Planctomycetota bacterium]|nr:multifunctional oxoglutarate decarboxylase/oxoglutarate dehydrogenase thiamine pyrophosphate-binding subunit/dihydrolipoyllysine-residue succinyltransferase subunit [Planctomycetota bacterium]
DAEPLRGVAGKIVRNMEDSLGVPTATSVRTTAVRLLEENRNLLNHHFAVANRGKASFTHLIAYALVRALREMPRLNAAFARHGDQAVRLNRPAVHLGLAIDLEGKDGSRSLVVPAIKDADALDFGAFYDAYNDVIERARRGKLAADDFQGVTVTLTNPGTLGTLMSVPRLMAGQGAIIATGAIGYPAEFSGSAPEVLAHLGVGKVMTITSTYDHRIIQGAESGLLLKRIDDLLQGADGFYEDLFAAVGCPHLPFKPNRDRNPMLAGGGAATSEAVEKQARVLQLINAYRVRGALIADLDPLGYAPHVLPELELEHYGLSVWDLDRLFLTGGLGGKPMATLREILGVLQDTYARRIGVEYMHIGDLEQKKWLQQRMEPTRNLEQFSVDEQARIIERLVAAEAFEKFLHTRYVGHKRFSLEGAESLIPALDELLNRAVRDGATEAVMGMAHRGRLNVLVNTFNKPYTKVFAEFEGLVDESTVQGSGDVKYHLGAEGEHVAPDGKRLKITLASNPSHLEAVNPVVEGVARAKQEAYGAEGRRKVLPILIHGDAAFAGQGVVAETLNMSGLRGYATGGTVHVVVNNQIGYTAGPRDTRSTYFCTDLAKSVGAPILHVNGDYPESVLRAVRVAFDWRQKFGRDVVIDLVCYRRHGHNETDEPKYTQPILYSKIEAMPSVREKYGKLLVQRKQLSEEQRLALQETFQERLKAALELFRAAEAQNGKSAPPTVRRDEEDPRDFLDAPSPETGVAPEALRHVAATAANPPEGHAVHPNLRRQLERRVDMVDGKLPIDWGCGEALAFGSLLLEGVRIRLAGQDSGRGTFSQRHAVVRHQVTEADWIPLNALADAQGRFEVVDSLLSEEAALGFEFGFAHERQDALVLWEAQFGDFVNGAQIQIDQFLAASEAKWNEVSGVVLLLPHAYDGQGPEHSSARLERFLQLCAEGNLTVVNCSTSAQYFHLLRRQGRAPVKRPLVVMTPKSLLKKKEAGAALADFATGAFREVLDDPRRPDPATVSRLILCSGKVFYDLDEYREAHGVKDAAILRLEQLYPLPRALLLELTAKYRKALKRVLWVQEEPKNMGAWSHLAPKLADLDLRAKYVGRPAAASPAAGSGRVHAAEQEDLLRRAFES